MFSRCFIIMLLISHCELLVAGSSDSLRNHDYNALKKGFIVNRENQEVRRLYLTEFLKKAKRENNIKKVVSGYKYYLHYYNDIPCFTYADSMVYAALQSENNSIIGSAYLTKGIVYYSQKQYNQALDNYLLANDYILQTENLYLKNKVRYNLAHIKYYLGLYPEAIMLYQECIDYFKANNNKAYLNTLHSIALCYNRTYDYGRSSELSSLGLTEGERLQDNSREHYFYHLKGINYYFKKNYKEAISKLNHSLPQIQSNNDFANEAIAYFYLGKSYIELNLESKGIEYFKKVEHVFDNTGYVSPDLREGFELLIKYYHNTNNLKSKLHYTEKLLKVDSILNANYKYLTQKIHIEYDTKILLKQKNDVLNQLEYRKRKLTMMACSILLILIVLVVLICQYIKNKKHYKQRFEELMRQNNPIQNVTINSNDKSDLDLNQALIKEVLLKLEKFENNNKYLEGSWTLSKMAAYFNINTSYLSKIIHYYRGKKFVGYINDLKVDYLVELLKSDKKIRNYTNKALAEEVGFSSTQRFRNAFLSRTGISPTYFIEKLKREINCKFNS